MKNTGWIIFNIVKTPQHPINQRVYFMATIWDNMLFLCVFTCPSIENANPRFGLLFNRRRWKPQEQVAYIYIKA